MYIKKNVKIDIPQRTALSTRGGIGISSSDFLTDLDIIPKEIAIKSKEIKHHKKLIS